MKLKLGQIEFDEWTNIWDDVQGGYYDNPTYSRRIGREINSPLPFAITFSNHIERDKPGGWIVVFFSNEISERLIQSFKSMGCNFVFESSEEAKNHVDQFICRLNKLLAFE